MRADLLQAPGGADSKVDILDTMLREAVFDERGSIGRSVDGDSNVSQQVRQGANVVLVSVGDHDRTELLALGSQPLEVGVDELRTIFIGESDAAVDGDRAVATSQHGAVHADLVEAAQGGEGEAIGHRAPRAGLEVQWRSVKAAIHTLTRVIPACYAPDRTVQCADSSVLFG